MLDHIGPPQLPNPKHPRVRRNLLRRAKRVAKKYLALLELVGPWDPGYADARDWYAKAMGGIQREYGERWEMACAVMAATSPQCDVRQNVVECRRAMDHIRLGILERWEPWLPCHENNVWRAANGEPLSGQKVENFRLALLGEDATVIDTWMLRAAGYCKKPGDNPTRDQVRVCYEAVGLVGIETGLANREVQALVWTVYRNENWIARRGSGTGELPL